MCIHRVSSMPTKLIVPDFFVYGTKSIAEGHCCIHQGQKENAFSRAKKRAEVLRHPCSHGGPQTKGDKIRIGSLTPTFSGAQKRAEMLGMD